MPGTLPRLSPTSFTQTHASLDYLILSTGAGFTQVGVWLDQGHDYWLPRACAEHLATDRVQLDVDDIEQLHWSGTPRPFEPVRIELTTSRDGDLVRFVMRGRFLSLDVEARTCTITRSLYNRTT